MLLLCSLLILSACQGLGGEPAIVATIPAPIAAEILQETLPDAPVDNVDVPPPTLEAINIDDIPQVAQAEADIDDDAPTGRITGRLTNATADGTIPPEVEVMLVIDTGAGQVLRETEAIDGAFAFDDVPFVGGYVYFVVAEHDGVPYFSEPASAAPNMEQISLPVTIFEATDSADAIIITSILSQIDATGDFLEYIDTISVTNTTDRTFLTEQRIGTEARRASLSFELPPGALFIGSANDPNAFFDRTSGVVFLTRPIYANASDQITLQYIVPYRDAAVIEFATRFALNGAVGLLAGGDNLVAEAPWILTDERRTIGERDYRLFGGPLTRSAGETIRYDIRGASVAIGSSQDAGVVTSSALLPIALILGVLLVGIVAGVVLSARRRGRPAPADKDRAIDNLLRQIARIESEHDAGTLNHDVYQRRKAELQARLDALLGASDDPTDENV